MNNTQPLTKEFIFNNWAYDESTDQYHIETPSHGFIVYSPDEDIFIINEGTRNESVGSIEEVNSIINPLHSNVKEPVKTNTEQPTKLSAQELNKKVSDYEKSKIIFMNFKLDNDNQVWGLPEGDKTLHGLSLDRLNDYNGFLNEAIKNYTSLSNFFNNDLDYQKKLKKYKLYQKRLNNLMSKLNVSSKEVV